MHIPYDIMVKLKVMFEDQNHDDRWKEIKVFLNTNMAKEDPRSSNRRGNPSRFDAHKIIEVHWEFFALTTGLVEDYIPWQNP